jgi:hypothetical protein
MLARLFALLLISVGAAALFTGFAGAGLVLLAAGAGVLGRADRPY